MPIPSRKRGFNPGPLPIGLSILATAGVLATAGLAGCAQTPPPAQAGLDRCQIRKFTIAADYDQSSQPGGIHDAIDNAFKTGPDKHPIMLMLSGGSEHGAFGAGYLDAWAKKRGGQLPTIRVVTAISTGALQSTFAFIGKPASLVSSKGYEIQSESELLIPTKGAQPKSKGTGFGTAMALVKKGALASLEPGRKRLGDAIDDAVLNDVAARADTGNLLYVGAVDMDSGEAVAFDLSELAQRWRNQVPNRARIKGCYLDAIIASASAPMAAAPVFIDGRMYVDGGLRFALFANEMEAADTRTRGVPLLTGEPLDPVYRAIVNTDLAYRGPCPDPKDPCIVGDNHRKWRFDQLALGSVGIFVNQNERMSTERLMLKFGDISIARIKPDWRTFKPLAEDYADLTDKNCADWRSQDDIDYHPLQFHKRYMRCMISYGRAAYRANAAPW